MAPELARARYGLAQRLQRSGRRDEAAREMETFRRLTQADQERVRQANLERARLDQGWELLRGGKAREAEALFSQLGPNAEALSGVAFSRSAAGDHRGAVAALEKAVTLAPERDDLRRALDEERLAVEGGKP
jgi:tetratricopeptide (TPR) repeat protein